MLAAMGHIAPIHQLIDGGSQFGNGCIKAFLLNCRIIRNQVGNNNAGFMQHRIAEAHAIGERLALQHHRPTQCNAGTGPCERLQFA